MTAGENMYQSKGMKVIRHGNYMGKYTKFKKLNVLKMAIEITVITI